MINTKKLIDAVESEPGDVIAVDKKQLREMLAEIALGNAARQTLVSIGSIARLQPGCAA